jgi:dethiobiotin synthetase
MNARAGLNPPAMHENTQTMPQSRQLFITATDTGVGKTLVSGLLLGFLLRKGIRAGYQKWLATGGEDIVADLERVRELAGLDGKSADPLDLLVPYRLPFPASPHLAAALAGREIDPGVIFSAYEKLRSAYEILLVEGVGGVLVPLGPGLLLADLAAKLRIPTLLVARTGLGTLNHTLLSLEALRRRDIPVLGVLCTDSPGEDETIAADNLKIIAEFGRIEVFGRLPFGPDDTSLRTAFNPLAGKIYTALS